MHLLSLVEPVFAGWEQIAGVAVVLVLAQAIYVLFGFGAGIVALGSMALFMPRITDAVVVLVLVSAPSELWVVLHSRREIAWRGITVLGTSVAAGTLLGTQVLARSEPAFVLTALAVVLVGAGALFLGMRQNVVVRWPVGTRPVVGLISGVLAGLFGVGGPPLVLYFQMSGLPKAAFRASLMAIFLLMTLVRLPAYTLSGLITLPRIASAALLLPAALLGGVLGHRIHVSLSEARFRRLISVALCVIGLLLLLRQLSPDTGGRLDRRGVIERKVPESDQRHEAMRAAQPTLASGRNAWSAPSLGGST